MKCHRVQSEPFFWAFELLRFMRLIIRCNTYNYMLPNIWHILIRQCIGIFRLVSLTSTIVTAVYNDFLENLVSLSFAFSQKSYERATSPLIDVSREQKLHRFHGTESHRSFETVKDSKDEDYKFPKIPRQSRIHTRRILLTEKCKFSPCTFLTSVTRATRKWVRGQISPDKTANFDRWNEWLRCSREHDSVSSSFAV